MKKWLISGLVFVAMQCQAGFYTGNQLLEMLRSSPRSNALTYIAGVSDATDGSIFVQLNLKPNPWSSCVPEGVTQGQLGDVVYQHLTANPATRHLDANWLVVQALQSAWPCRKPN